MAVSSIAPKRSGSARKRAAIFPGAMLDRTVLEIVTGASVPLGAYRIADAVAGSGKGAARVAAVYRSLDRLCARGEIERIETLSAYRLRDQPQSLLLIHSDTHQTTALPLGDLYDSICEVAAHAGFKLERLVLEAIVSGQDEHSGKRTA